MLIWGQVEEVPQLGICKTKEFSQLCGLLNPVSSALEAFCLAVVTLRGACGLH